MRLHEYHAGSLEATLNRAVAAIVRMERLLTVSGEQAGVVNRVENTLSPQCREVLLSQLHLLQAVLAEMAKLFSLDPHPLDLRRALDAEISTLWVLLENCRPPRMKGYGQEFAPDAKEALEAMVEKLVAHVLRMRAKLEAG